MTKKYLARLLVFLLMFLPVQTALCEELDWPDDIDDEWYEDIDDIEDDLPLNEDVVAWYDAMDVYDMFANCPVDIDYDQTNGDGSMYLVMDDRFANVEALLSFARLYFSDEIAERLIDMGMYAEEGGRLFARDIINYMDENIDEITVEPNIQSNRMDYEVTVTYVSPNSAGETEKVFIFTRELLNGQWRFTEFPEIA